MRIPYKNKQININLILGIIWLIHGIVQVGFNEKPNWFGYGWLVGWFVFSAIYLTIYFYQRKEKYLTIENGIIKQNWPSGKKMNLAEIKQIRYFAGDYILKTERTKMPINIQLVDENSLADLKTALEKLNVEWH